jgi:hypothetical protein
MSSKIRRRLRALTLCASLGLLASPAIAQEKPAVVGTWEGALQAQGVELAIIFHIAQDEGGALTATMDSPDQGAYGIPVDGVEVKGDSVLLTVGVAKGEWEGIVSEDASTLDGVWRQSGLEFPLVLGRSDGEEAEEGGASGG